MISQLRSELAAIVVLVVVALFIAFEPARADPKTPAPETKSKDGQAAQAPSNAPLKIADAAWLAGVWKSSSESRSSYEEHWSKPAAGSMVGMFRMVAGERAVLFEFQMIEETADGTFLRLRHYGPGMTDREAKPIRCKLIEADPNKLVFENPDDDKPKRIVYGLDDAKVLTVVVETIREGKVAKFALKFQRES